MDIYAVIKVGDIRQKSSRKMSHKISPGFSTLKTVGTLTYSG